MLVSILKIALPAQDFHSGGTVCSPTRATVLTGRNHFRDCVDYVYGCSDMTECVPSFNFAPQKTFTVPMAVRAANKGYKSWFGGKVRSDACLVRDASGRGLAFLSTTFLYNTPD